jgi:hypothetical protein
MTPMSAIFDATLSVARSGGGSRGATLWPFSCSCIDVLLLLVARLADFRNDSTRGRGQLRLECKQFKETQRCDGTKCAREKGVPSWKAFFIELTDQPCSG